MNIRAIAVALAIGLLASIPARAAERSDILVYRLLGLDQQPLFGADHSPLAELEAWSEVYSGLRDEAMADASTDLAAIRLFMFAGWTARQRGDADAIGGFRTDMTALYTARPDEVLSTLADNPFLIPAVCGAIGESFAYEDGDPAARAPFVEANTARVTQALGDDGAPACLAAMRADGP